MTSRDIWTEKRRQIAEIRKRLSERIDAVITEVSDIQAEYRAMISADGIEDAESVELWACLDALIRFIEYDPSDGPLFADYSPNCLQSMTIALVEYAERVGNKHILDQIQAKKKAIKRLRRGYHRGERKSNPGAEISEEVFDDEVSGIDSILVNVPAVAGRLVNEIKGRR